MHTLSEALENAALSGFGRCTGSKVWANSPMEAGQEGAFWQPFPAELKGEIIKAAETFDRLSRMRNRREGKADRNGSLGHVGLEVLRYLLSVIDYRTGALFPALKTIAAKCGRSTAAIHDALKRLDTHGFVKWVRRYVKTGRDGLRGPQVKQTSNAYRITVPAAIAAKLAAAPPPDDDSHRRAMMVADREAMVESLPLPERMAEQIDDPGLAAVLARLGAALGVK